MIIKCFLPELSYIRSRQKNYLIMKKTITSQVSGSSLCRTMLLSLLMILPLSCRRAEPDSAVGEGVLCLHFSENSYEQTKAAGEVPDTSDFILKITGPGDAVVYDGKYGDSPERLQVKSGSYNISVRSGTFSRPAFSSPLYGDDQCVVVKSGGMADVYLACEQLNAGIRLKIAPDFLKNYPAGVLFLKSAEGKLMYGYSEKRIAYFSPGNVSLLLNDSGQDRSLFTKPLKARQVLTVNISAPSSSQTSLGGGRLHISVDTSRTWVNDSYKIGSGSSSGGGSASGATYKSAYNVTQAKSEIGAEDVWVYGYIVGGDLTSASVSFDEPFSSNTNIAIAGRTSVSEKESCFSVQLVKGSIRDALNLADNPENLKRKVYLKGDIVESYYGIPGIKNISDYVLE